MKKMSNGIDNTLSNGILSRKIGKIPRTSQNCFVKVQGLGGTQLDISVHTYYKTCTPYQCLIAIASQGVISFPSPSCSGKVSGRTITENCRQLKKLVPGDQILATVSFTVQDGVCMYCEELVIPSFTKGSVNSLRFKFTEPDSFPEIM